MACQFSAWMAMTACLVFARTVNFWVAKQRENDHKTPSVHHLQHITIRVWSYSYSHCNQSQMIKIKLKIVKMWSCYVSIAVLSPHFLKPDQLGSRLSQLAAFETRGRWVEVFGGTRRCRTTDVSMTSECLICLGLGHLDFVDSCLSFGPKRSWFVAIFGSLGVCDSAPRYQRAEDIGKQVSNTIGC